MTQSQRRVIEDVMRRRFSVSPFDVPDASQRDAVQAGFDRWLETWVTPGLRDVLRVEDREISSRELLYFHPGA